MSLFRVDSNNPVDGPHQNQETVEFGVEPEQAAAGVVLLHGRGASARSILSIARELKLDNVCYRALQAQNHTWYPHSFMEPIKSNEPGISSGLQAIHDLIDLYHDAGLSSDQIVLMGFSQGACLALEFAARHPQGYGAIVGFSGGLIGASVEFQHYYGSMEGTPIFLGCSEEDPHIPAERVDETAKLFRYLDASVTEKLYENLGHTINQDELSHARDLIEDITG